jgi:hypothetical protein
MACMLAGICIGELFKAHTALDGLKALVIIK